MAEITLDAALRDVGSPNERARNIALRNLVPVLFESIGLRPPLWQGADRHPRGPAVAAALRRGLTDPVAANRGIAAIGLGQFGDSSVIGELVRWLDAPSGAPDAGFLAECAVIALSFLGNAAPTKGDPTQTRERIVEVLARALRSPRADVRFQASVALVEVAERAAESTLIAALRAEFDPTVRENLVIALSMIDPPGPEACQCLAEIVAGDERDEHIGFEAARALAAARRQEGGERLVLALSRATERDDALEALAVLAPHVPAPTEQIARRIAKGWLTPAITRVRAAYLLARLAPDEGLWRLRRLARHPRPAVREAVADARRALEQLDGEKESQKQ